VAGKHRKYEEKQTYYRASVGKSAKKCFLRNPWLRWQDNIKADFKDIGLEFLDWIFLAQGQVADTCE
jgi:hypothetical protein